MLTELVPNLLVELDPCDDCKEKGYKIHETSAMKNKIWMSEEAAREFSCWRKATKPGGNADAL
jgi:hypothetical protein